jgi:predicted DNA-binding protein (MmcQ/YjbR family)
MNIEDIREYCLSKKGAEECLPFDDETLVFKVGGKMFAMAGIYEPIQINVKCIPDEAILLREQYPCVKPGYHMNKKHWNTIDIDGSVSDKLIFSWIDQSYHLVFEKLTRAEKEKITG